VSGPVGLTWDELDELADFAEGLLEGAAHERVATLVQADERWALAYASLVETTPAVRAALQAAGRVPASVPDDVATRLEAALATQAARPRPSAGPSAGPAHGRPTAATGPRGLRPGQPARRRRIAGVVAGALVLVAVVGFGAAVLRGAVTVRTATDAAAPAVGAQDEPDNGYVQTPPELAPTQLTDGAPGGPGAAAGITLLASGTDYRRETLHLLVDAPPPSPTLTFSSGKADAYSTAALPALATNDGLSACVAAVLLVHHGQVTRADYARFEGQPALVLVVQSPGTSTVVAVGGSCGQAGTDELAAVDVP